MTQIIQGDYVKFEDNNHFTRFLPRHFRKVSRGQRRVSGKDYNTERIAAKNITTYHWNGFYKDNEYTEIKFE